MVTNEWDDSYPGVVADERTTRDTHAGRGANIGVPTVLMRSRP